MNKQESSSINMSKAREARWQGHESKDSHSPSYHSAYDKQFGGELWTNGEKVLGWGALKAKLQREGRSGSKLVARALLWHPVSETK